MKKLFYLLSSAALLFGATSCDKGDVEENIVPEVKKTGIVLNATIANDSRTTLDGKKVDWAEGDCIYLVTSDATWGKPYVSSSETNIATIAEYVYSEGAFTDNSDAALPELTEGTDYTVYAMYARADQKSFHRGAATSHRLLASQSQDCANPTAHIATNDALVGKFTVTGGAENTVDVSMHHIYTMMEVDVKNNTGAELTITKFEMQAENATLAGDFTVNFGNTAVPVDVTLKDNDNDKNYEKITVNVANGTVAAGASLPIYFIMAPLTDYSGDVTFTVTDSEGYVYTQTVTVEEISFEAGKYNTTPYTITEGVAPVDYSGTYVIMQAYNGNYYYMSANDGGSANNRKAVNTGLTTLPASDALNSIPSMANKARWTIAKSEDGTYTIQSADNGKYLYGANASSNYAKVTDADTDAEPINLAYDADTDTYTIQSTTVSTKYLSINGSYGIWAFYKSSYEHNLSLVKSDDPLLDLLVSDVELAGEGTATSGVIDVTLANNEGWTVTVSDNAEWLTTETSLNGSNQVVYSVVANDTGTDRTATVSLTATKGSVTKVVSLVATQKAPVATTGTTYTKITSLAELTNGKYLIVYEVGNLAANGSKNVSTSSGGIGANASNVTVVINANTIAGSNEIDNAVVTIAKSGDKYTVQNAAGDYMNSATNTNGYTKNATADDKHLCTISFDTNNNAVIANFDETTHLTINKNSGSPLFRFYKVTTLTGSNSSNYAYPALYKLVE